jgi:MoaA/NifB/PqqE/SkfB family radical SAM enzyme
MIGIPIDGSSDEILDKFRIYEGSLFEKQIKILDFFEGQSNNICINTVFHKFNREDMENIYKIIKKYNCVKKWQVFEYMPIGSMGKLNRNKYEVKKKDFLKVKRKFENMLDVKIKIEFKPAIEREYKYMLVNSCGDAYKVNIKNHILKYGNIGNPKTWKNIVYNLI